MYNNARSHRKEATDTYDYTYRCDICGDYHTITTRLDPEWMNEIRARIRAEFGGTDTYMSQPKPKEPTREEKLQAMARQDVSPTERDTARRMLKAKGLSW